MADKKKKRPTAEKRMIQNEKCRKQNRELKSRVRTALRRFEEARVAGDKDLIEKTLSGAYSMLDKAAKKGIFKKNKSSRLKARLTAKV